MYICVCNGVTDKQINAAMDAGITDLSSLKTTTGLCSDCGKCGQKVRHLMKDYFASQSIITIKSA